MPEHGGPCHHTNQEASPHNTGAERAPLTTSGVLRGLQILLMIYRVLHGLAPRCLTDFIHYHRPGRGLRSATDGPRNFKPRFEVPWIDICCRCLESATIGMTGPSVRLVRCCGIVSPGISELLSLAAFKRELKTQKV